MTATDKLELVLEYAKEYYTNDRLYKFFKDGFISYEIFEEINGTSVYFADIFVKKSARGTGALKDIIDFCSSLGESHGVTIAYCQVDRSNPYLKSLQSMYKRLGFKQYSIDKALIKYMWVKGE